MITKNELREIGDAVAYGEVADIIRCVLGDDRAEMALDLLSYPSKDLSGKIRTTYEIQHFLDRVYDFAVNARESGDEQADNLLLEAVICFQPGDLAIENSSAHRQKLSDLLQLHTARLIVEYSIDDGYLSREQVALLGNLKSETVRVAAFEQGDKHLPQDKDGLIEARAAKTWLVAKKRYQPLKKNPPSGFNPKVTFSTLDQAKNWVVGQARALDLRADEFLTELPKPEALAFLEFLKTGNIGGREPTWLKPKSIRSVAKALRVSPKWLFAALHELVHANLRQNILRSMEDSVAPRQGVVTDLPDDAPVDSDTIRDYLLGRADIDKHPDHRKGNKKMDGYITSSGRTFTHEHNLRTQYLWVPQTTTKPATVVAELYPLDGRGRHSGLGKYHELANVDLHRIEIRNFGDLVAVVNALSSPTQSTEV